jgi:RHS repeat-associated protein
MLAGLRRTLSAALSRTRKLAFAAALAIASFMVVAATASGPVEPYSTYESTVASDTPVAQYRFDEAAGATTLADSAGTRNATATAITLGGTGPFGGSKAGAFNGTSSIATIPSTPLSAASAFTAEAWVNWSGGASYNQRVFYFGSSNTSYMFLTPASPATNHPLRFEIRSSSTAVFDVDAPTLAAGGWHYLAVTEDTGGTLRLYLDGAQVASKSGATISPATLGATTNSWLGKSRSTTDPLFAGSLSNVAFYTTVLSATQIAAHWNAANFPVNTTLPAISGTTSDGQTLTSSNGTWSGLSPISFGYQWQRCDAAGNNCADVAGATAQTYGLTTPDVGAKLQVKVKGTNAAGNSTASSATTAVIASAAPHNSAVPTISGTATDGQTLSADKGTWTGSTPISYAYQWQRCDSSGANCADIAGASAQTYGLVSADVGSKVRVVVTGTNSTGNASANSATTSAVAPLAPANTVTPTIAGFAREGRTLSADNGSWSGTAPISYGHQWRRCDASGFSCSDVAGATGSTYSAGADDVGATIRVAVTATNAGGASAPAFSAPTAIVDAAPPAPSDPPAGFPYAAGYNTTAHGPAWLRQDSDGNWQLSYDQTGEVVTWPGAGGGGGLAAMRSLSFSAGGALAASPSGTGGGTTMQAYDQHGVRDILAQVINDLISGDPGPGPLSKPDVDAIVSDISSNPDWNTSLWNLITTGSNVLKQGAYQVGADTPSDVTTYQGVQIGNGPNPYFFRFAFPPKFGNAALTIQAYDYFRKGDTSSWFGNGTDSGGNPAPFDGWSPAWVETSYGSAREWTHGYNFVTTYPGTNSLVNYWCDGGSDGTVPPVPEGFVRTANRTGCASTTVEHAAYFEPLAASVDGPPHPKRAGDAVNTILYFPSVYAGTDFSGWMSNPANGALLNDIIYDAHGLPGIGPCALTCPGTTYGTHPTHGINTSGTRAEPVDTATGAYTSVTTDLALPAPGVPFALTRSYTSADQTNGELGRGWSYSSGPALEVKPSGDVVLHAENGQQLLYAKGDDGNYYGQLLSRSTLAKAGSNYVLTTRDQVVYTFDAQGKLQSEIDRNGEGLSYGYGGDGRLATVTDAAGHVVTFTHNADGTLASVSVPDGRHVDYGYTGGHLTSVTDVRGNTTSYSYDAAGHLNDVQDQNGHTVVHNTYGADGRVSDQLNALSKHTGFSWDAASLTATMTDPRGKQWQDVYAPGSSELIERIDPLGNTTSFSYDANGNRATVSDARGNTTAYDYADDGDLRSITAPAPFSYTQSWTWNARHDTTSYTNGRGNVTNYGYDANGNLKSVTAAAGTADESMTSVDPNPATGLPRSVTDPRGKTTSFQYFADGNLQQVTSPLGETTTYSEDAQGRRASVVDPRGNVAGANPDDYRTSFHYDAANHLTEIDDPYGHAWKSSFDPAGDLTQRTDPNNHATGYSYYADNRLHVVTAPDGSSTTTYGYDDAGNTDTRTDANGHVTKWSYDDAGQPTSITKAFGTAVAATTSYSYDPDGNLETKTDANGNATQAAGDGVTSYGYDELGRPSSVSYSDVTPDLAFGYDADSNRTSMSDGGGSETYSFDALDRLKTAMRGADSFSYGYDAASNVARRSYPSGAQTTYGYDDDGRMASMTALGKTTGYQYWPDSSLKTTTLPAANGYSESRAYDRAGRLTDLTNSNGSSTLSQYDLSYDAAGNPTQIVMPAGTRTFGYDSSNRLNDVCYQATACTQATDPYVRYGYDGVGNRSSEKRGSASGEQLTNYGYDALDRLTSRGSQSYSYDQDGNELSDGSGHTYAYDLAGNRVSTTAGSGTTTYTYSGDGLVLGETAGGQTTSWRWDENGGLAQLAETKVGSDVTSSFYGLARVFSSLPGGVQSYYHYDPQGSVTGVTDATGQTQRTYDYDPFGTVRSQTAATGAPANRFGFAGEASDATSGLSYMRARWYEPGSGRFTALDPLAPTSSDPYRSAYLYADARPTVFGDPSGLCSILPWKSDSCAAPVAAGILDGLTGGLSTQAAGAILGFSAECTTFGSGAAHDVGFAGSFFVFGEERVAAEGGGSLLSRLGRELDLMPTGKGGRLEGPIPDSPRGLTPDQLQTLRDQLEHSIAVRHDEILAIGIKGGHGQRLAQEARLLRQVNKALGGG